MKPNLKKIPLLIALFFIGSFAYAQSNANNVPLITVTGESTVHVKPDEVTLTFGVETKDEDAKVAKTNNDKLMSDVHKYLKAQKIDPKNIQTDYVRLNAMYVYNDKDRKQEYAAVNTVSLKLTDIAKYETIVSGLLERGINKIDQVSFGSSKLIQHQTEARNLAIQNAKEKADALASAIGQSIGKAYYINENSSQMIPYPRVAMKTMNYVSEESSADGPTIAPGEIEIKGNVTVSFVLD